MCSFLLIYSVVTRKPIIPPLDWCSTCHAVLITVELFKGLSEMIRLAELTCKLRLHVSAGMAQKRIKIKGRNTRGDKLLQHVAATNRFVCTVKRQITCAHCGDRFQRQIAWCERFDIRCLFNQNFVAATEFCRCNMLHKVKPV